MSSGRASDLHPILEFRYQWIFGDEGEKLALHGEWQWDDEQQEDGHLHHQEDKDLSIAGSAFRSWRQDQLRGVESGV